MFGKVIALLSLVAQIVLAFMKTRGSKRKDALNKSYEAFKKAKSGNTSDVERLLK